MRSAMLHPYDIDVVHEIGADDSDQFVVLQYVLLH
jgi:hypothetical protein